MSSLKKAWESSRKLGIKTSVEEVLSDLKSLKKMCGAEATLLSVVANGHIYPCNAF